MRELFRMALFLCNGVEMRDAMRMSDAMRAKHIIRMVIIAL